MPRKVTSTKQFWIQLWQGVLTAFSTFSLFPVQAPAYRPENLRFTLAALPLVGAAIGLCQGLVLLVAQALNLPGLVFALLIFSLEAYLTGFIHLDGLADASDAIFSRRDRDRMLEIMHDPLTGPMAVIALVLHSLWQIIFWSDLYALLPQPLSQVQLFIILLALPAFLRALSGGLTQVMPKAHKTGMSRTMAPQSDPLANRLLALHGLAWAVLLVLALTWRGLVLVLALGLAWQAGRTYYMKSFAGISGDLAGQALCLFSDLSLLLLSLLLRL